MKIKKSSLIFFILIGFCILSCSSDDDVTTNEIIDNIPERL